MGSVKQHAEERSAAWAPQNKTSHAPASMPLLSPRLWYREQLHDGGPDAMVLLPCLHWLTIMNGRGAH